MSATSIQWTDATWNAVRGCARVSPGCERCYAERQAHRFSGAGKPYEGLTVLGKHGPRWAGRARFVPEMLDAPLRWRKPRRVFVNSMSDLFHDDVTNEQIAAVFGVMAACPRHTFQILTKRPERMLAWFRGVEALHRDYVHPHQTTACIVHAQREMPEPHGDLLSPYPVSPVPSWPLRNVWLGVSCEDQQRADERIPLLLECPAAVRFVSAEPLLSPIDFTLRGLPGWDEDWKHDTLRGLEWASPRDDSEPSSEKLSWVIVGGESGPGARPCDVDWIRSIVQQCKTAGVPVFVKQLGSVPTASEAINVAGMPIAHDPFQKQTLAHGERFIAKPRDRKGGDPSEWPEDLRVRQFPEART